MSIEVKGLVDDAVDGRSTMIFDWSSDDGSRSVKGEDNDLA